MIEQPTRNQHPNQIGGPDKFEGMYRAGGLGTAQVGRVAGVPVGVGELMSCEHFDPRPPRHESDPQHCQYLSSGACYWCCRDCNYQNHRCHFCGEYTDHNGYAYEKDGSKQRHWLSDCRPDLVQHEIGDLCTWPYLRAEDPTHSCYAYEYLGDPESGYQRVWTDEHKHFWPDGRTS